ncbi:hypothetical protein [Candidatus Nitrosotenuis cloacae]|uniref:hypothetical protein n=1 Tax=Candidatus Nitrosotenuis cloacae TaxID=1603555 RepID=UPI00227F3302|nr:hypothetical protein [Candidatus Nitrosotenuis cloacae]
MTDKQIILLIGILSIAILPAFAAEDNASANAEIFVTTSKDSYVQDEQIMITGSVKNPDRNNMIDVTIRIVGPLVNGESTNIVAVLQVKPSSGGLFDVTAFPTSPAWKDGGDYRIIANYGALKTTAIFSHEGSSGTAPAPPHPQPAPEISIIADKASYKKGDVITFSGKADRNSANRLVSISIHGPHNGFVTLASAYADSNSDFKVRLDTAKGSFAKNSAIQGGGTYTATAFYDNDPLYAGKSVIFEFSLGDSAAALDAITVHADKQYYRAGDTITVFGTVRERLSGYPVTLQIIAANGNLVVVEQLDVSGENKYGTSITDTDGALWRSAGTYSAHVIYGTETRNAKTTFVFGGAEAGNEIPDDSSGDIRNGDDLREKITDLQRSLDAANRENQNLRQLNSELQGQVEALQKKVDGLSAIINEQIKVIYQWVMSR